MNYIYTLIGVIIGILLGEFSRPARIKVDYFLDRMEKEIQNVSKGKTVFIDPITKDMKWEQIKEIDDLII